MTQITLIVAIAENGVIGRDNAIPWRLKADQQRFKAMTMGKPLVMGRKTFLSLRRPLPGRTNIVVTRDTNYRATGAVVANSFETACAIATADARRRGTNEIVIMGGVDIYRMALPFADRLEVTEVHMKVEGDTYFPAIDPSIWQETTREAHQAADGDSADFTYVSYRRIAAGLPKCGNVDVDISGPQHSSC